jgi:hypothetical protein
MRIYNAKRAQIEMPLSNGTKLVIPGNSVSGEFMPNSTIISVFMTSYSPKEVAFVISGPFEIAMLSNFAGSGDYVVSSLEEAVARFAPKVDPTTTTTTTEAPRLTPVTHEEEVVKPTSAPKVVEKVVEKPKEEIVTTSTEAPVKEEIKKVPKKKTEE